MFTGLLALAALLAATAAPQPVPAELHTLLHDPANLPVAAAAVRLTHLQTGLTLTSQSSASGHVQFLALPAGGYSLQIDKPGFAPLLHNTIHLRLGDRLSLDLRLPLAAATHTVDVTAAPPLLAANQGAAAFHLEQRTIATLPLDGRNFVPLIALSPGVNLPPGSLLPRINGSRPRVNEYIYDGISVLQPEPGQVAFYPIVDAIDEFRIERNSFSAEYGRSNGGVILVNQKSGSNLLHGSLFEFFRHERLNSRNLFAPAGPKPRFRRNQSGFVLGGPLQRNRTFFFADYQNTRLNTGVTRISTVPTAAQQDGRFTTPVYDPASTRLTAGLYARDLFPANAIPASRFDTAAAAIRHRYPAILTAATINNYRRTATDNTIAHQFDTRLDRYFQTRHRLFTRYSFFHDDTRPTTPLPDGSGNLTSGVIADTVTRAASLAAEHTLTISPSTFNQLRFGYTRRHFQRRTAPLNQLTPIPGLPSNSFDQVLPTFDIVGFQQLGPPASANATFATSVTQILDHYAHVRAAHSLKAGADIRFQSLDVLQPPSPTGNFQFTSLFTAALSPSGTVLANTGHSYASFLLGQVSRFAIDVQPQPLRPRARIAELYLQDDWRATRRLTLNLGLRYTLNFPSTVAGNRGAIFNLDTQQLDFLGVNGFPRTARNLEKTNFAPRVGIAFTTTPTFVIRAGYGLTWIEQAGITTPFTTPLFPFIQTLSRQTLDNLQPAFVLAQGPAIAVQPPTPNAGLGQGVFAVQRNNGSGYAQQWNFLLQKTLAANWSLEAGYLGSKLTRLGVPDTNLNQLSVSQLQLGASLTQSVPNPFYGQIPDTTALGAPTIARGQLLRPYPRFTTVSLYRNNTGYSTYHSFQAKAEKRFSQGFTFTAAYTFSRLIDDAGAVFDSAILTGPVTNFQAADSFNRRLEKDVSTGNMPHIFSTGFVYQLPIARGRRLAGGWQLAGLFRAQSGTPLALTQATNLNAFAGFGIQRPNRLANPTLSSSERTIARWFNPTAFAPAPQFTLGASSRNPVTGPGYRTLDVMLGKTFSLTERTRLEFRAEAFNATNTPPLANPNTSYGTPAFASITSALDPRVYELVLKVHF